MGFVALDAALKVGHEEFVETRVGSAALFDKSDLIANTEAVFEEKRSTETLHSSLAHDADSVTEHICLVHVMGSQDDDSIFLVGLKHVPQVSAGSEIHT